MWSAFRDEFIKANPGYAVYALPDGSVLSIIDTVKDSSKGQVLTSMRNQFDNLLHGHYDDVKSYGPISTPETFDKLYNQYQTVWFHPIQRT